MSSDPLKALVFSWVALSVGCGVSDSPSSTQESGGAPLTTGGAPPSGGQVGGTGGDGRGGAAATGGLPPAGGTSGIGGATTGGVAAAGSEPGGATPGSGGQATGGAESPTGGMAPATGGESTGGTETSTGGSSGTCEGGPLADPLPSCEPTPVPDTGDYYADCVARINQLRWECQCLPPLDRWPEGEACADQQAQYDYEQDEAHAGFSARICDNGGSAQNECPGYGPRFDILEVCLQQMWDEGPGEPYSAHGHYINMTNPGYTRVACGRYTTPEGDIWAVQNFSR
jgi:hypothetical protein